MPDPQPTPASDRNLIFGILALQMDFIRADQLIEAMQGWMLVKTKPLGEILVERGFLSTDRRKAIERLVEDRVGTASSVVLAESTLPDSDLKFVPPVIPLRYSILREHAEGGLGRVFVARDTELNREVALKRIKEEYSDQLSSRTRFLLEGEITGQLEHPGIVPVYGLGTYTDGRPYYAMRFIRGQSLREAILAFHKADIPERDPSERSLAMRELLQRFLGVCNAVAYAHSRGVLHRDLKPANVMLGPFGETLVVDWGLAKLFDTAVGSTTPPEFSGVQPASAKQVQPTRHGYSIGTPSYMAPEQAEGRPEAIDRRTDVYLLGGILYKILSGHPPHPEGKRSTTPPSPKAIKEKVPAALDVIVRKALAIAPASRHAKVEELASDVQRWLADEPLAAYRLQLEGIRELVQGRPEVSEYREQAARECVTYALILGGMERFAESEPLLREALQEYEILIAKRPKLSRYRAEAASTRIHLSRVLVSLKRPEEAEQNQQQAIADFDRLMATNPDEYRANLASVMLSIAPSGDLRHKEPFNETQPTGMFQSTAAADSTSDITPKTIYPEESVAGTSESRPEPVESRGRFTLLRLLARGGASSIWLAHDNDLHREVVIKDIPEGFRNEGTKRMFLNESRIMARLEHPNIIPIYGLGYRSSDDFPFLIMKLVEGHTLLEAIREYYSRAKAIQSTDDKEFCQLIYALICAAKALGHAHRRGIVHCDPKPSNLLIDDRGNCYVADWGLAQVTDIEGVSWFEGHIEKGDVFGTPSYMAPEQAKGLVTAIGPRTDICILGATLFHVLTGRPPFQGTSTVETLLQVTSGQSARPRDFNRSVPASLEAICLRAMAFNPEDRYTSAEDLADDLERWMTGRPVSVYPESRLTRLIRRLWPTRG